MQIHQLTKHQSQNPFSKSQPSIQRILFHPNKPFFFVATQREIKVYNLIRQSLQTTLHPSSAQWISSISIHPNGDHLICGTYDQRIHFFDMDLSNKPYRTFSKAHHGTAVREVAFHSRYPMFGTSGDDGEVHIFHASVGKTWNEDALVVPVKMLKKGKHQVLSGLGVLCCMFHPVQPWIFSSGADGDIKLYT